MKKIKFTLLCMAIAGLAMAGTGYAEITVGNPGFEDGGAAPGGYSYDYAPWESLNEGGGYTPWLSNGYYAGEMGTNIMYTTGDRVYQSLAETFTAGNTYTFSMDVAMYPDVDAYAYEVFIYDATTGAAATPLMAAIGTLSLAAGEDGVPVLKSVSYTATVADAGNAIGVGFVGDYYTQFDNAVLVPEPMTLGLLGLGAIGLIRRKRR